MVAVAFVVAVLMRLDEVVVSVVIQGLEDVAVDVDRSVVVVVAVGALIKVVVTFKSRNSVF